MAPEAALKARRSELRRLILESVDYAEAAPVLARRRARYPSLPSLADSVAIYEASASELGLDVGTAGGGR